MLWQIRQLPADENSREGDRLATFVYTPCKRQTGENHSMRGK
jgi:hypothetical protein